ncbi:MAG: radical SAM protein [Nanoarchaeota archaeon]|nr:radical SAM protein [Nanoarchaeota archaeon]
MKKTKFYSWLVGKMPVGCQLCVQGRKEVLFITGLCGRDCYFCPISDEKKNKDVIYANERPVKDLNDIVLEAKLCSSKGAGITGGDPLVKLERTIKAIKLLKKEFGNKFHIHLYTSLDLVSEEVLRKLEKAGLDEIRFHPRFDDDKLWHKIKFKTSMDKGIEIPVIPGKYNEILKLIGFIDGEVKFLNLNELEMADCSSCKLVEKGFETKNDYSYAVKGSEELAKKLLRHCEKNTKLNVHYCTVKLKDAVQMVKRLKLRAENVAMEYDKISKDGTLLRGAVYLPELKPDFGFNKRIKNLKNKKLLLGKLEKLRRKIMKRYGVGKSMIKVDEKKVRLLTSKDIAQKYARNLKMKGYYVCWVEDDPTYDQFEIESEEL